MPSWKKLVVSGSDASLNSLNVNNTVTANKFVGDGSELTGIAGGVGGTVIANAFDEDSNGDLMPSSLNDFISLFYELDDNLDLMPRI